MPREALLPDKQAALIEAQRELSAEMLRLAREEEYLTLKIRQAREQVHYYEGLLELLRQDLGRSPGLSELVRKLG